jgi:hypothetical protein
VKTGPSGVVFGASTNGLKWIRRARSAAARSCRRTDFRFVACRKTNSRILSIGRSGKSTVFSCSCCRKVSSRCSTSANSATKADDRFVLPYRAMAFAVFLAANSFLRKSNFSFGASDRARGSRLDARDNARCGAWSGLSQETSLDLPLLRAGAREYCRH